MTKREAVRTAIAHKNGGPVPYNVELTSGERANVCAHLHIEPSAFFAWSGSHIEKFSCNIGGMYTQPGFYKDEFGVTWDRSGLDKDIGINDTRLTEPDFDGYTFPAPDLAAIRAGVEAFTAQPTDTYKMGKLGLAYFERAWSLTGFENLLAYSLLEPAFVEALFEQILQYNLQIIEAATAYDLDGFYFGDDYGQQSGLIISPDMWRKFIKPGLAKMFEAVRRNGMTVALHSCGDIREIMGDLIDIGLDVYQTVQPEIYDLKSLKAEFGRDLAFWGGISTQRLLPFATPDLIRETVRETVNLMSRHGGYIASPTHQVPSDVPPENIVALVEALRAS